MNLRARYMAGELSHAEYYEELRRLVGPSLPFVGTIMDSRLGDKVRASKDAAFNDTTTLQDWDTIGYVLWDKVGGWRLAKLRSVGESDCLMVRVCILKQAVARFLETEAVNVE